MDKCPVAMRATLERHLFKGGLLPVQMQLLQDAAQEGKQDAKAFLEAAAQAKAYLDAPILPKVTGNGATLAQKSPKTTGPELPRAKWNRLNSELNQKAKAMVKNNSDLQWHEKRQLQIVEEGKKNMATIMQLKGNRERMQNEWNEISEQAGQTKIAYDCSLAAKPAQPEASADQDIEGILAKINSVGLAPR
jgi:hypothetical protein